ncbi:MAG: hypothetical protein ACRD94_03715 [Nitrosopumilaceae archaeon]
MKTKYKISLISVIVITVAITASVGIVIQKQEYEEFGGPFNYKKTKQIIDETYLSKTVQQWQDAPRSQLEDEYKKYGDDFYTELGRLLIKNEMMYQIQKENIVNANDGFEVYSGMMLTSLPPHISFEAVINGTDGKTYRLQGTTNANRVSYYKTTELVFYDTSQKLSIDSILSQSQTIKILEENGTNARVVPYNLVIDAEKNNIVEFENTLVIPIRIQGDGDYQNPNWYGPTILPYGKATMKFNNTGAFEWHARTLQLPGSEGSKGTEHKGGGQINVLSSDTDKLPLSIKQQIAQAIIQNSEIPLHGIGVGKEGLTIDFNRAIYEALPDTAKYYKARAQQLIPFDVPLIIEEPYG